jgi:mRNA interferase RelE/StbE
MTFDLRLAKQAATYVERLDGATQRRIISRLEQLAVDPFGAYSKPLTNATGRRSSRVGDYRIIYSVDVDQRTVDVSAVAPRGRAYRDI